MKRTAFWLLAWVTLAFATALPMAAATIKVLLVDGQNNHDWRSTSPVLKRALEESGLFAVDVATTPPAGGDMTSFKPDFAAYQVVVSNYNGERWSRATEEAFERFVQNGGGLVSVHAADNAFPDWKAYNEMIGIGGWGDRNEKSGPYVRWRDGKVILDSSPGRGGSHGKQHAFLIQHRDPDHPILRGLPPQWMHAQDELYDRLRGPAARLNVLATADSTRETGGSGEIEPMLMTIQYGRGRVFHTTLGHSVTAMKCVGFITTLQRGTEWAATGHVTQKPPVDFPDSTTPKSRH